MLGFRTPQIEITTLADIPSGTGLGSSGSFTTALLKALYVHRMRQIEPKNLAEVACEIEIDRLGEPIGKQDQYIAACGGLTCFTFHPDDSVDVEPLKISMHTKFDLEDNLLLFFTGFSRSAGSILKDQNTRTKSSDKDMIANLHFVKELGLKSKAILEAGKTVEFGALMHEHWEHKKRRSGSMSNSQIDEWYELGVRERRRRRQARRRGRRRLPLFYANDRNNCATPWRRPGSRRSACFRLRGHEGAVLVKMPVAILMGGWLPGSIPSRQLFPRRLLTSRASRLSRGNSTICAGRESAASFCAWASWVSRSRPSSAMARQAGSRSPIHRTGPICWEPAVPEAGPSAVGVPVPGPVWRLYLPIDFASVERDFLASASLR